ncbi:glycoside hydrolase family 97 protein [Dyadobacter psychrotolerans]|uniref:Glycoside hydrolase family 97 protein n=1 Tax=Dyadobacter psychrotolerans TaxID=2541721 RepID=A0A4R5DRZ4_9BACT|nr:glycoside hydrolase family 97 protein [Dyadobacter psychrotolerans]TDE14831.1 hypothetical protein E0F88_16755 [Dyadobacter psychrotolerans]
MRKIFFYLSLGLFFALCAKPAYCYQNNSFAAYSPDQKTSFEIKVDENKNLVYRILSSGKIIIDWSAMGLVPGQKLLSKQTKILKTRAREVDERFAWPYGERDSIINHHNEITLDCRATDVKYTIIARIFDGSVAFRYALVQKKSTTPATIVDEATSFNLPGQFKVYQYNQESVFTETAISEMTKTSDLPSTLVGEGIYISIGEADNSSYTKAILKKAEGQNTLKIGFLKDSVHTTPSFQTPWRTISFSRDAIGLHQFSDLPLRLVDAKPAGATNWIKPGKLIRSSLSTQAGLDCIDFAASHNFQYIMFDAGWYGPEFKKESDATKVIAAIDMKKVIEYGKSKGIGVILYVNRVALQTQIDQVLPLYKSWGVAGLKFGFIDGLSQSGIKWLVSAIEKVYQHGLMLNIHDNYKPTGLSRTYPNLLTQEGIRGNENNPDAYHNMMLPFTRFLAGAADYTFCYPNSNRNFSDNLLKTKLQVSKGQQLALSVIYFSPIQAILWYGNPNDYKNEIETEFFKLVPTTWNQTQYLKGEPGKFVSVARRKNDNWYIGSACAEDRWEADIRLDFLSSGQKYKMTVYSDEGQEIIKSQQVIEKDFLLPIRLAPKSGQAVILEKQ